MSIDPAPGQPYFTHVVGIDTSMTNTGIAVNNSRGTTVHNVKSVGKKTDTWDMRYVRLIDLAYRIADHVPLGSFVVMEAPAYSSRTGSQHDRAGLWWLVWHLLKAKDCVMLALTPQTRMTYTTGKGNSGKDVVLAAVVRRYPDIDVTDNNVADAVAFMAIGRRLDGNPIDTLPATHLRALAKIDWKVTA